MSPYRLIDSALLPYHGSSSGGGVCVRPIALSPGIRTSWFPQSHHKREKKQEKKPLVIGTLSLRRCEPRWAEDICAGKSEKCGTFTERDTEKWEKSDEWRLNSLTGGQRTT